MLSISRIILISCMLMPPVVQADISGRPDVQQFIEKMATEHQFNKQELVSLFAKVEIQSSIIKAITRPAEALPWYKYRSIFLKKDRIEQGVRFWKENQEALDKAHETFGVPPEIIVAIIGVETRYGNTKGSYNVVESLSTLAFDYPRRSSFFTSELEAFMLLAREQKLDPSTVTGSYAGAMGIPQFISSSYRAYAYDFDDDGTINIWTNYDDAIGSVANYFKVHGWISDDSIAFPVNVVGDDYKKILDDDLKSSQAASELSRHGIDHDLDIAPDKNVKLLEFEINNGHEYWLGFHNFYVISRYNHSKLYSMAVFQLAMAIQRQFQESN